jgi:hypothetical protein
LKWAGARARTMSAAWNGELLGALLGMAFSMIHVNSPLCIKADMYGKYHFSWSFISKSTKFCANAAIDFE